MAVQSVGNFEIVIAGGKAHDMRCGEHGRRL